MSVEDKIDRLTAQIASNHRETMNRFIALDSRLVQVETWMGSAARLLATLELPAGAKLDDIMRGLTGLMQSTFDETTGQNVFLRALCDELGVDYDALRKTTEPASAPAADVG